MAKITTIKIHPGIGVARLGNSPTEFFIGPEKPQVHVRPSGGYRDKQGRIKRQAAGFRLFGYDKNGKLVKEITSADATTIEWTVHLVNSKAAWKQFDGLKPNTPLRNAGVADRKSLVIDPGPRSVSGANKSASFDTGKFLGTIVPLGDIRSDSKARLLVLGGFGNSGSPTNAPLGTFANNNGWHDDVSDGPVGATVTLKGSGKIQAMGAWVIVGPPKFAPPLENIITLYDVLFELAVEKLGLKLPAKPSFTKDIYPLLQRAIAMQWVSGMITSQHAHATLSAVIPPPASKSARLAIFNKLRDPSLLPTQSSGDSDMPMIHSDFYPLEVNQPLTRTQYGAMKKWKDGDFINDWSGAPVPSRLLTPGGLDRAALESCVGGAFYPGIEASWMLRDVYPFSEPFRLDPTSLQPGDVTKQMALPWQADFNDCAQEGELAWWPAQRPDDVFPESGGPQVPWTRGIVNSMADMVQKWHRLGFVVKKGAKYVETERNP